MSAWTIYWILQLDSINSLFFWLSLAGVSVMFFSFVATAISEGELLHWTPFVPLMKRIAAATLLSIVFTAFLPSTKTAAAMVIVPAIVNNETVQNEAGELYQLAKQALREAVTPDRPQPKK